MDAPAQARLKAEGHPEQEGYSRKGIFDLPTQAQKFLMQLFTKSCDLGDFLKVAVEGEKIITFVYIIL
ncbi:MAG: hypothetical protein LBM20_00865 [Rikenellaceae bacterium]|nr:hypothetical protein [Rikenellaceae bacterium]